MSSPRLDRRDVVVVAALVLFAALTRLPRLGQPPTEVFDEVYHAKTALEYLEGRPPTEWVHPPTAKLLIATGVALFGYTPWAWRLAPALAGLTLSAVFYLLARRVLARRRAALLAGVLLALDGVFLVQSRMAMTNVFAVLFQVAAALFVVQAVDTERPRVRDVLLAGLFVGLAVSTRWTSLWAAAFLGLVVLVRRGRRLWRPRELTLLVAAGLVLPACVYAASYVPWMRQGHTLRDVVRVQRDVWRYHADLRADHPYYSAWYTWPWLYRPTWYHFSREDGWARGIIALGNPPLWLASVPVTLWALVVGARRRDGRLLFAGLGYCALYLPWGLAPRVLNFSHYLFEAIPYACLSLGALLDESWDEPGRGQVARGFVLLAGLLFLFSFPVLTAWPVPAALLDGSLRTTLLGRLGLAGVW